MLPWSVERCLELAGRGARYEERSQVRVAILRDTVEQVDEHTTLFGRHRSLVSVVTPATDHEPHGNLLGALLLNAGVVHRIGPNRMSVRIARVLAATGVTSVRFDLSGLGDSPPRRDRLSFGDAAVEDTQDVMSQLEQTYGVRRFVLIGLCSGGAVSFKTALADERVVGMVLTNPTGFDHDEEWTAQVKQRAQGRRYRRLALHSGTSWLKALSGKIDYRVLAAFLRSLGGRVVRRNEKVSAISRRLSADFGRLLGRGTNILVCCSEGDPSLGGLELISEAGALDIRSERFEVTILPPGDHALTLASSQRLFLDRIRQWVATVKRAQTVET